MNQISELSPAQKRAIYRSRVQAEIKSTGCTYDQATHRVNLLAPGLNTSEMPELANVSGSMARKQPVTEPRIQTGQKPTEQSPGSKFRMLVLAAQTKYGQSYDEAWQTVSMSEEGKHLLDAMKRPTAGPGMKQFGFGQVSGGGAKYNSTPGMVDPKTGKQNNAPDGPMEMYEGNPRLIGQKKKTTV